MPLRRIAILCSLVPLAACDPTGTGPSGPGVRVEVAPLLLEGVDEACYDLLVSNGSDTVFARGDTNWTRLGADQVETPGTGTPGDGPADTSTLCSGQYGNGRGGGISYVGTCDASTDADADPDNGVQNDVTLWVDGLYKDGAELGDWQDPCPGGCTLSVACNENADSLVEFNLTLLRAANQGFFDIAVNFDQIFCSAKVDCADANGPLALLHDPSSQVRGQTVVLALACTGGPAPEEGMPNDTVLLRNPVVVDCAGVRTVLDPTIGGGNAYTALTPDPDPNDAIWQYATYFGTEALSCGNGSCNKRYWNVAIGFEPQTADCEVTTSMTAARNSSIPDHTTPDASTYPWIEVDVQLTGGAGGLVCTQHPLNGTTPGVTTRYTPVTNPRTFCHRYDGAFRSTTLGACASTVDGFARVTVTLQGVNSGELLGNVEVSLTCTSGSYGPETTDENGAATFVVPQGDTCTPSVDLATLPETVVGIDATSLSEFTVVSDTERLLLADELFNVILTLLMGEGNTRVPGVSVSITCDSGNYGPSTTDGEGQVSFMLPDGDTCVPSLESATLPDDTTGLDPDQPNTAGFSVEGGDVEVALYLEEFSTVQITLRGQNSQDEVPDVTLTLTCDSGVYGPATTDGLGRATIRVPDGDQCTPSVDGDTLPANALGLDPDSPTTLGFAVVGSPVPVTLYLEELSSVRLTLLGVSSSTPAADVSVSLSCNGVGYGPGITDTEGQVTLLVPDGASCTPSVDDTTLPASATRLDPDSPTTSGFTVNGAVVNVGLFLEERSILDIRLIENGSEDMAPGVELTLSCTSGTYGPVTTDGLGRATLVVIDGDQCIPSVDPTTLPPFNVGLHPNSAQAFAVNGSNPEVLLYLEDLNPEVIRLLGFNTGNPMPGVEVSLNCDGGLEGPFVLGPETTDANGEATFILPYGPVCYATVDENTSPYGGLDALSAVTDIRAGTQSMGYTMFLVDDLANLHITVMTPTEAAGPGLDVSLLCDGVLYGGLQTDMNGEVVIAGVPVGTTCTPSIVSDPQVTMDPADQTFPVDSGGEVDLVLTITD